MVNIIDCYASFNVNINGFRIKKKGMRVPRGEDLNLIGYRLEIGKNFKWADFAEHCSSTEDGSAFSHPLTKIFK